MNRRPIFLRGLRRIAVGLDVNLFEAVILIVFAAIVLMAVTYRAWAGSPAVECAPPNEGQVLVWAWRDDGAASCQYTPGGRP